MPANLPPAYYEAERKYQRGKSIPEKVAALQEMTSATPKHKGTDRLRADLRAKMARLMEDLQKPRNISSGQPQPFALRKDGIGQVILIGLSNVGKSQLLATLTGATAKVAAYPFTTQVPQPGMLQFQNVLIQLVDTPAIDDQDMQTRLFSLLRNTDLLLVIVDLSLDALEQVEKIAAELEKWGYLLLSQGATANPDEERVQKRAILVGSKADEFGGLDQFQRLEDRYGESFHVVMVSAQEELGLDDLKEAVYRALDKVRVYTKAPGQEPDYRSPIVLPHGSKVEDAAQALHRDMGRRLKHALLWGSGKFDGQTVGREYVLADGDVLEFHG